MNLPAYLSEMRGRAAALARSICVSPVTIHQWAFRPDKQVPAERCPAIEKATGGAVTCEELRPDVDWQFIRANPVSLSQPKENPINPVAPTIGAANPEAVHE